MFASTQDLRRYPELSGKTFLICVGGMKCATSWIHDYLGGQPDVAVSPLKELHFFNAKFQANVLGDMDALALKRLGFHISQDGDPGENLRRRPAFQASVDRAQMLYDDDAYFAHFARLVAPETRVFCDITPAYAVLGPTGFEYLRDFCASQEVRLRLLFVMRDPIDRLWSQLRHMTQASAAKDFTKDWAEAFASPRVCARADYQGTVTDLDQTFGADQVLYLFYEELFQTPALQRLSDFIGVPLGAAEPGEVKNETRVKAEMPEDARQAARALLAPQYAFCRDRFGEAVPAAWIG